MFLDLTDFAQSPLAHEPKNMIDLKFYYSFKK
jgi:hypothetical protein